MKVGSAVTGNVRHGDLDRGPLVARIVEELEGVAIPALHVLAMGARDLDQARATGLGLGDIAFQRAERLTL